MAKKNKTRREKQLMLNQEKEELIQQVLNFSRKRFKKFAEIIDRLYLKEDMSFSFSDRRIWKISECFGMLSSKVDSLERKIMRDMLVYLQGCSELVNSEECVQALFNMALFRSYWRNDLFNWKPSSKQATVQVNELVTYLFCRYKVPDFLYKSFYEKRNMQPIGWLIHLGSGGAVKDLKKIPIPFTKKMGHYFTQAPVKFSIAEALRWAQVKGLKGEDRLAERIAYSWLGTKTYGNEEFWEAFLQLIVNGGMFNQGKVTELIDYVRESKRLTAGYTLKGRTLQSLLRQSDIWHNSFTHARVNQVWKPCGIEGFKTQRKTELVILEELTDTRSLSEEGRSMKHCVGSYAFYCAKGKSAIFSLRKFSDGILLEILATIEVNLTLQRVVQAKAKMNKTISAEAKKYMETWAEKERLSINVYL